MVSRSRSSLYFGETEKRFSKMKYYGIYRDDGVMVFDGCKSKEDINRWLLTFQGHVDRLAESDCLQFTAEVWGIEEDVKI